MKRLRHIVEAGIAYATYGLFRILPIDAASAIGGWIARLIGPLTKAHRTGRQNLIRALPDLTDQERRKIMSGVWDNFGRAMTEYTVLSRLSRVWPDRIEVVGGEHIRKLAEENKPGFMVSAHIGNWEVTALTVAWMSKPPALIYRAPNNPLIAGLLHRARGHAQTDLIPKGAPGARDTIRFLKDGRIVEAALDQKMNTGLAIPFFGRDAMTGDAVARLALKHHCPIVPGRSERLSGCRFRVTYEEPWLPQDTGDTEADVRHTMERINQIFERWIRDTPDQWLWLHNRWPKDEDAS
jgi:KDO2-lipid IV(A) lauroyltransferase